WSAADMLALPFDHESFDYVLCQFGMMFVPDKSAALREARRVLKRGGKLFFSVWDDLARNGMSRVANDVIIAFTQPEPIRFVEAVPFAYADEAQMRDWLMSAGFEEMKMTPVELDCLSPSAREAALGLVQGTPVVVAVKERDQAQVPALTDAVAAALAGEFGEKPCRSRMRALLWETTR
ncbi:MAG: methyltransferase domain-containing protein, partial [Verrucomicrobiota bacterium]|nr:methyltransferase domain-containing protein [Verrucomicrobiota bacterium]